MSSSAGPVLVVGAGAAGILAAWRAASLGARVILLEKTSRIGTKILISGGGKCNITHDGPIEDVLRAFRSHEARFIRPACYRFPNSQIVDMLTRRGLEVYTRPDGRIFPRHQSAKDVLAILRSYLDEVGVEVRLKAPVRGLEPGRVLLPGGESVEAGAIVVASGGCSYPASGTSGDAWVWLRRLGHTIVPIRAALAPIHLACPLEALAGVALRDVVLKGRQGKRSCRWRGDLLFTHRGVSGPATLGISREVAEMMESGPVLLEVDLYPDETFESMQQMFRGFATQHPRRRVCALLEERVPEAVTKVLREAMGEDPMGAAFSAKQRNRLVERVKGWPLGDVAVVDLEKGEVAAGGVALDEVDPQTMESRLVPGLFLCGEVLDIAGPVGGYNLQAAFATGFVAGECAAHKVS